MTVNVSTLTDNISSGIKLVAVGFLSKGKKKKVSCDKYKLT